LGAKSAPAERAPAERAPAERAPAERAPAEPGRAPRRLRATPTPDEPADLAARSAGSRRVHYSADVLRTIVLWLIVVGGTSCGTSATPPPIYRLDSPGRDAAARLAARLPSGADSCAVARVADVSARRRPLLRELSSIDAFAWAPGAPTLALAQVGRRGPDGRESRRVLLHVDDVDAARRWVVDEAPLRVLWVEEDPCRTGARECRRWHARALDEHTIQIARGPWAGSGGGDDGYGERGPGTQRRCADLAHRRPEAIELAIERQGLGVVVDDLGTPFGSPGVDHSVVMIGEPLGVRWEEDLVLPTELPLEVLEVLLETREDSRASVLAAAATRESRRTAGGVRTIARIRWEDLELARDDAERLRVARVQAERARAPLDPHAIDVTDRALVDRQVALRRELMQQANAGGVPAHAEALKVLLERAVEVHPDDAELVGALVRTLTELGDGELAARWATHMLEASIGDPEHWRQWRRRALAHVGADALGEALRSDGLARGVDASVAAEVLVAHTSRYEAAEAAWLASRTFARLGPRPTRIASAALPAESAFETMLLALDVEGLARSLHAVLTIDAPLASRVGGALEAPIVSWSEGRRGVRVGASTLASSDGLRGFGIELANGLPEGATFELTIALLPFGGDPRRPDAIARARGRVREGALVVDAFASTPRVALRWENVPRYLAEPLAELESRLFPPPDLELELDSEADALLGIERARSEDAALDCVAREARLRCQATPEREVARRAWRRVVEPWIVRAERTTTRP